jgi:hypothetical protein
MTKVVRMLAAALVAAAVISAAQAPTARTWLTLQEGLNSKRAAKGSVANFGADILIG